MPFLAENTRSVRCLRLIGGPLALGMMLWAVPVPRGVAAPTSTSPAASARAVPLHGVAERLAAQNRLFAQQYEDDLKASPETRTSVGDYDDNARLDDYSLGASARRHSADRAYLQSMKAIPDDGFPDQDRISHQLFMQMLAQRMADYKLKTFEMPISPMDGIHNNLADLPNAVPLDSVQHYEDYLARLRQIPRALRQTLAVLRQGVKDGLVPPRLLLTQIPAQCTGVISENPFVVPVTHFPASIGAADQQRLAAQIRDTVDTQVLPAYQHFADYIAQAYVAHGRTSIGLMGLPQGARRYAQAIQEQTSTHMSAAEIHALGLREVARITGLLVDLARRQGFSNLAAYRTALNGDPTFSPRSAEQIVEDFRRYTLQMQPKLSELFNAYPTAPLTVEPVPDSKPGDATHYVPGTADGARAARIVVATSNYAQRRLLSDETIAYHEGVPGHHLQISLQERLTGLPAFRQQLFGAAFAEGWAVYAEALGKEIGFFQDAASDYGRLNTELMRAVRLVIDTGIHADGWTRDQAVEYLRQSGAAEEPVIQAEVNRYIAWPAQGLSYKIGQLEILRLRQRAQQALGSRFDIRTFHDQILNAGNLPLDLLEARIDAWLANQG